MRASRHEKQLERLNAGMGRCLNAGLNAERGSDEAALERDERTRMNASLNAESIYKRSSSSVQGKECPVWTTIDESHRLGLNALDAGDVKSRSRLRPGGGRTARASLAVMSAARATSLSLTTHEKKPHPGDEKTPARRCGSTPEGDFTTPHTREAPRSSLVARHARACHHSTYGGRSDDGRSEDSPRAAMRRLRAADRTTRTCSSATALMHSCTGRAYRHPRRVWPT